MNSVMLILSLVGNAHGLPSGLLPALCYVESRHKIEAIHRHDGKGSSLGVCQIKLSTARQLGFVGTQEDLMGADINAEYAARYLVYQYQRYGNWSKAITAYNQGTVHSHGGSEYLTRVFNAWVTMR